MDGGAGCRVQEKCQPRDDAGDDEDRCVRFDFTWIIRCSLLWWDWSREGEVGVE